MSTPKIIWQTWKTKKSLPDNLQKYHRKWLESHPDYEHVLLDDEDLRNIVKETVPEYLEIYDSFSQNIERVDFARYALLYSKGGVYADLDTVPLKKIDKWVELNKPVIGCEPLEHAEKIYSRKQVLCNAFMISPPGEKIWKDLMEYIVNNYEKNINPVDSTGPMAMTKLYENNPSVYKNVEITDPCVFYPLTGSQKVSKHCDLKKDSYVAHIWTNTWTAKNWFDNPLVWNTRYWLIGLFFLTLILLILMFVLNLRNKYFKKYK
jgi:mannosyltransferase OCH1-like enzyme